MAEANDVRNIYFNCECNILPTVTENYGHSIVEALVAGCPCIIPQGTTPWDAINARAGYTYKLGDIEGLQEVIQKMIDMNNEEYKNLVENTYQFSKDNFVSENLVSGYIRLFNEGDVIL